MLAISVSADPDFQCSGFLLTTDGQLNVTLVGGETLTFAAGTFATGVQYALQIDTVDAGTTAVGWLGGVT